MATALCCESAHAGGAVFFHPDGMGANTWGVIRNIKVGPDSELNWDKMPNVAIYKGHMSDTLTASSNGGATVHAYGEKASVHSFGLLDEKKFSIAHKALNAGKGLALVNSGHINEPGSAAFVARANNRYESDSIAGQVIHSGAQVILSGGEKYLLPKGTTGRHGKGGRHDDRNLIKEAEALGYLVVYNAEELATVDPKTTPKLLGVFARRHTFNDEPQHKLNRKSLPTFEEHAPTIAQMTQKALAILQTHHADNFLLIAEEEATDNFANVGNVGGTIEAGQRADDAIGVVQSFIKKHPDTTMVITSDSDAGGMQLRDCGIRKTLLFRVAGCRKNNSYTAKPNKEGKSHNFYIKMVGKDDFSGGVVIRGEGKYGHLVKGTMDNTSIYTILDRALFRKTAK